LAAESEGEGLYGERVVHAGSEIEGAHRDVIHARSVQGPGSEQHAHEGADFLEAHSAVGGAGGGVVVVDVEADDGGDVGEGVAEHGGHARLGEAAATVRGVDPDALDLAGERGGGADLGL